MAIALVTSATFGFNDGNGGHLCNLGSAPSVGDWDFLCVNSDTVVATPSGFNASVTAVANQGAYIFSRKAVGGEASTVTITTTGNLPCSVVFVRLSGANALDIANSTQANASIGATTPAHSTGTLAQATEAVLAFGAMHSIGTANQNTPVWSTGFTPIQSSTFGTGASGVLAYVGWKTPAGTAAENPQVSWSGDGTFDRYMLTVSATAVTGASTITGSALASLGALVGEASGEVTVPGTAAATLGALTGTASGDFFVPGTADASLGALGATASGLVTVTGSAAADLGRLVAEAEVGTEIIDVILEPLMDDILACLCEAVAVIPNPPEHCCFRIGEVAHDAGMNQDLCCEGLAYVSLGDIYPSSTSFPEQDIIRQAAASCAPPTWAVAVKMGIVRCAPVGDLFNPPNCVDWNTAAKQNIYDSLALRRAACCVRNVITGATDALFGMSVIIERQTQGTPSGGCVERSINMTVQIPQCQGC